MSNPHQVHGTTTHELKQVAILIESSSGWGRRLIEGVLTESKKHHRWQHWVSPEHAASERFLPSGWVGDGIIAMLSNAQHAEELAKYRVPIVNVSSTSLPDHPAPQITTDHEETSRLALEHLTAKGFKRFGYVGPTCLPWVESHYKAFQKVLESKELKPKLFSEMPDYSSQEKWRAWNRSLSQWLDEQPKPFAVISWNAPLGREVIEACRSANIQVPHEVSVLGSNTDRLLNQACDPPLAAIDDAAIEIGKIAANYLDRLMRNQSNVPALTLVKPTRVIPGGSTDTLAVADPQLAQVMQFIDAHAFDVDASVEMILRHVPMARRALERKFSAAFGHPPGEELRRRRIMKAKAMLVESNQPMSEIAEACGYSNYSYLHKAFKKATGLPPTRYRTQWMTAEVPGS